MVGMALATVPISQLEYRAVFLRPVFDLWSRREQIADIAFSVLEAKGLSLSGISFETGKSIDESQIVLRLPHARLSVSLSPAHVQIVVTDPSWSSADLVIEVAETATQALAEGAKAEVERQQVFLNMHLLPQGKDASECLSTIANPKAAGSLSRDAASYGFAVYSPLGWRTIDSSRLIPGAVFVSLARFFGRQEPIANIAEVLRKDELEVLALLELKVD